MKVGGHFLPMSVTILEKGPDFLFGLDMMRRYQCAIDLKANALRFAVEPEVALPFLAEHELPAATRFELQGGEEQPGARRGRMPKLSLQIPTPCPACQDAACPLVVRGPSLLRALLSPAALSRLAARTDGVGHQRGTRLPVLGFPLEWRPPSMQT